MLIPYKLDWEKYPHRMTISIWAQHLGLCYKSLLDKTKQGIIKYHTIPGSVVKLIAREDIRNYVNTKYKQFNSKLNPKRPPTRNPLQNDSMSIKRLYLNTWQCNNYPPYVIPKKTRENNVKWDELCEEGTPKYWDKHLIYANTTCTTWYWINVSGLRHEKINQVCSIGKEDIMEWLRIKNNKFCGYEEERSKIKRARRPNSGVEYGWAEDGIVTPL